MLVSRRLASSSSSLILPSVPVNIMLHFAFPSSGLLLQLQNIPLSQGKKQVTWCFPVAWLLLQLPGISSIPVNNMLHGAHPSPGLLFLLQLPDVVLHDVGPEVALEVGKLSRRLDVVLQSLYGKTV
jgi:hypothetical protein